MNKNSQNVAILLAVLAAALYAISTPVSKVMLQVVPPTMVAAFLYLGAGIGVGTMMLIRHERKRPSSEERLHRRDIRHYGCRLLDCRKMKTAIICAYPHSRGVQ